MEQVNNKLNSFYKDFMNLIRKPVMSILPGQLSFFLLLSIIPIVLLIGVALSFVSVSTDDIVDIINSSLPANTSKLIIPLLFTNQFDYNILLLIVSALLLVSKGTRSIILVANNIYDIKHKIDIKTIIKSVVLSIQLVVLFVFLILFPIMGTRILRILGNFKIISGLTDNMIYMFNIIKWPITMFIIFVNVKIIYKFSPNKKIPSSSVNKGSFFTSIFWIISTLLYSFYITHLTKYNILYGSASNIIVLMLWIYLISYIFVLGMSINASYLKNQSDLQ